VQLLDKRRSFFSLAPWRCFGTIPERVSLPSHYRSTGCLNDSCRTLMLSAVSGPVPPPRAPPSPPLLARQPQFFFSRRNSVETCLRPSGLQTPRRILFSPLLEDNCRRSQVFAPLLPFDRFRFGQLNLLRLDLAVRVHPWAELFIAVLLMDLPLSFSPPLSLSCFLNFLNPPFATFFYGTAGASLS